MRPIRPFSNSSFIVRRTGFHQAAVRPSSTQYSHLSCQPRQSLHSRTRPRNTQLDRFLVNRRHASSSTASSVGTRARNLAIGTALSAFVILGYFYVTDTRAGIHRWAVVPALRYLYPDAEDAHVAGNKALRGLYAFGLHPRERGNVDDNGDLGVEIFGHMVSNPIGTSAGIDKNAEIPDQLLALGPGIVEVGGTTPYPQDGNPTPRVFRLPSQFSLINRYGLNSDGAEAMAMRLRQRVRAFAYSMGYGLDEDAEKIVLNGEAGVPPGSLVNGKLLAVQVAKNKATPDADLEAVKRDYVFCVDALARYADIIVVNVSSPNTPGLRDLQAVEPLTKILKSVVNAAAAVDRKTRPAVMVKVSPDEDSDEQIEGICDAIYDSGVDGVIVGNTTKKRLESLSLSPALTNKDTQTLLEQGGFSGPALFKQTKSLVAKYRTHLDERLGREPVSNQSQAQDGIPSENTQSLSSPAAGTITVDPKIGLTGPADPSKRKPIFASGGITTGREALEVIQAGASISMIYTALVYSGVGTVSRMKNELRDEMEKQMWNE